MAEKKALPLIFLDVGHAFGAKPGASADGVSEEDYNLKLRDQIISLWRARISMDNILALIPWACDALTRMGLYKPVNYGLVVSRDDPKHLYGTYEERLKEASRFPIDAHIQMHFNAFDTPRPSYSLVGYSEDSPYADISAVMANIFAESLASELDPLEDESLITSVQVKACSADSGGMEKRIVYCLKHADCPSILMEPLFLTTPHHLEFLKSPDGFMALVRAYTKALDALAGGLQLEDTQ